MATTQTTQTEQVARRYFDAWTHRNSETTASLLAERFVFRRGDVVVEGRQAFLDKDTHPSHADVSMVAEAYQDGIGFQMYDASSGAQSVRIVEVLDIRGGVIVSSMFLTDSVPFITLMTNGAAVNYNDEVEDKGW